MANPNPTQKFREKIKEEKDKQEFSQVAKDAIAGSATLLKLLVAISQISLMYLAYYVIGNHLSYHIFNYWEFGAIVLGGFSVLTFVKNYIKDFFNNDKKAN